MISREGKGKLIVSYNIFPYSHGSSTLACSLGVILNLTSNQKVLIINATNKIISLESFFEKDVFCKYSIDNISILGKELTGKDISTFKTNINHTLSVFAGPKVSSQLSEAFCTQFCLEAKKIFDFVIVDIGYCENITKNIFQQKADLLIACASANTTLLKTLNTLEYKNSFDLLKENRTKIILNETFEQSEKTFLSKTKEYYSNPFLVSFSPEWFEEANIKLTGYSYLYQQLQKKHKDTFVESIEILTREIIQMLDEELFEQLKKSQKKLFFKRLKGGNTNE